ncbi:XrtA-associated tyrosine autokinase [Thiomonas sp. FB-Cd]|uniref:XrtA-associated tyrosine autokinase n=1 Tax=Thiomonas sp. FB-Cd TaxID=1158292 RepID=UPI0004DEDEA6|nr:XrtA-associated tyrosine autokinase [Thiomonas sp. FB-Cd]
MSTIEQASKRLEQLRKAGVEMPWAHDAESAALSPTHPASLAGVLQDIPTPTAPLAPAKHRIEIDLAGLEQAGYLIPGSPRSRLQDEFRGVKRPLLANVQGRKTADPVERGNLIMITSSLPGEGKTFTSINLAMSMAMEMNHSVLLVDADATRMSAARRLGLQDTRRGLIDLLLDSTLDLSDVELSTNVDKLTFLPAGTQDDRATEIFSSQAMRDFLDRMAAHQQDRIVIFDAPPLLASAEARVIAPQMGQIVLVVHAGKTHQGSVQQALSILEESGIVMTLLNQSRTPSASSPYGYYAY